MTPLRQRLSKTCSCAISRLPPPLALACHRRLPLSRFLPLLLLLHHRPFRSGNGQVAHMKVLF
jgi:hypothetical protein